MAQRTVKLLQLLIIACYTKHVSTDGAALCFSILAGTGVFRIYYLFPRKERNEKDVSLAMCYNV